MSHCDRVLKHLQKYGSITQSEATKFYGCTRLAGRIYDLKERGINIITINEVGKNRYGDAVHYARYVLGDAS